MKSKSSSLFNAVVVSALCLLVVTGVSRADTLGAWNLFGANNWTSTSGGTGDGVRSVTSMGFGVNLYGGSISLLQTGGAITNSGNISFGPQCHNTVISYSMSQNASYAGVTAMFNNNTANGISTWSLTDNATVSLTGDMDINNYNGDGNLGHILLSGAARFSAASLSHPRANSYVSFASGSTAGLTIGTSNQTYYAGLVTNANGYIRVDGMKQTDFSLFQVAGSTLSLIPEAMKLVITSVNGGSNPTAGTGFDVMVQVQNTNNVPTNVVSDIVVMLVCDAGTGTLGGTSNVTISAGTSSNTISGVTYTKAESGVVLKVIKTGMAAGTSASLTVVAGAASKLAFGVQPGNTAPSNSVSPAVTVLVQDLYGNTVPGDTSSVTISSATTAFTGTSILTTNAIAGVATFNMIKPTTVGGGKTLTASAGSLTGATSSSFKVYDVAWWYPINGTGPQVNPWTSSSAGGHAPGLIAVDQFLIYGGGTFAQQGGTINTIGATDIGWNSGGVFNMSGTAVFTAESDVNLNRDSSGTSTWSLTDSASVTLGGALNFNNGSTNRLLLSGAAAFTAATLGGLNSAGEYISFASGSAATLTLTGTHNFTSLVTNGYIRADGAVVGMSQFYVSGNTLSLLAPPTGVTASKGSAGGIYVEWVASATANGYLVYRSTTNNGTGYGLIGGTSGQTATNYTDHTAQYLIHYYYAVSGTNSSGESVKSAPSSSVMLSNPGTMISIF